MAEEEESHTNQRLEPCFACHQWCAHDAASLSPLPVMPAAGRAGSACVRITATRKRLLHQKVECASFLLMATSDAS